MRPSHATYTGCPAVVGNFIDITRTKEAEERVRMLSRSLTDVIEEERKSLAADLHDEFGQTLTSLKFEAENHHGNHLLARPGEGSCEDRDGLGSAIPGPSPAFLIYHSYNLTGILSPLSI